MQCEPLLFRSFGVNRDVALLPPWKIQTKAFGGHETRPLSLVDTHKKSNTKNCIKYSTIHKVSVAGVTGMHWGLNQNHQNNQNNQIYRSTLYRWHARRLLAWLRWHWKEISLKCRKRGTLAVNRATIVKLRMDWSNHDRQSRQTASRRGEGQGLDIKRHWRIELDVIGRVGASRSALHSPKTR